MVKLCYPRGLFENEELLKNADKEKKTIAAKKNKDRLDIINTMA